MNIVKLEILSLTSACYVGILPIATGDGECPDKC
jgi:hypothetical protein